MTPDLTTILRAIAIVGEATDAGRALYEGFIAITGGADQVTLKKRYQEARDRSDRLHDRVQQAMGKAR